MPDTVSLDSAADELYAGSREEFTPRRNELAKAAKARGDQRTAAAIAKLAKPTTAAWLVNRLARDADADLGRVAELGEALRAAHANLDGAELRTLSQRRTRLVADLVERAGAVHGSPLTEGITRELEDILTAAVADASTAGVLLAGRLTSAKELAASAAAWPSVDGEVPAAPPRPATRPRRELSDRDRTERDRRLAEARGELERARAAVKEAEADRNEEERILTEAQHAAEEATEAVRRVYEELDAAEEREKEARRRVGSASRSVKDAERRASQAWRLVQQAEKALNELGEE